MKAVVTRVSSASVTIDGVVEGAIDQGYLVLLGVGPDDTVAVCDKLCEKICNLRIFEDENARMNRSILDVGGEALVVSNFTLLANYSHGNRPEYLSAAAPAEANRLYEYFCERLAALIGHVEKGIFGADMRVEIIGDGPVTIVMDSKVLIK